MTPIINKDSPVSLVNQIMRQVIFAVSSGKLSAGDQLTSRRILATELKVALNTVTEAYKAVDRAGVTYARHGSGVFVAPEGFKAAEKWTDAYFAENMGLLFREASESGTDLDNLVNIQIENYTKDIDIY